MFLFFDSMTFNFFRRIVLEKFKCLAAVVIKPSPSNALHSLVDMVICLLQSDVLQPFQTRCEIFSK